jgi:hypothetical protein
MLPTTLTVHEADFESEIESHTMAIEEYIGPEAQTYAITTQEDFTEASSIVNEIKRHLADLDKVEKTATRPLLSSLDTIRGWFKPAKSRATEASVLWKGKITAYLAAQAAEQLEVQRQLQAAAKAGNKAEMRQQLAKLEQAPAAAGVQVRQVWEFTIINEDLVPQQYWAIDPDLVQAEMRKQVAAGAEPVVPGVKFTQRSIVAATGR